MSRRADVPVILSLPEILDWPRGPLVTTDWLTLDSEQLGLFARATRLTADAVNVPISANNRWGPELVDGFLLVGLLVHFQWGSIGFRDEGMWGLNYGVERVRFPAPAFSVSVSATISSCWTPVSASPAGSSPRRVTRLRSRARASPHWSPTG